MPSIKIMNFYFVLILSKILRNKIILVMFYESIKAGLQSLRFITNCILKIKVQAYIAIKP